MITINIKKLILIFTLFFISFTFFGCDSSTAKFIRTNYDYNSSAVLIMKSVEDVSDYKLAVREKLGVNAFYLSTDIDMLFINYNKEYFASHILFVATLVERSGSIRHEVKNIHYSKSEMTVTILTTLPNMGTCDMAQWHLLIEVDRKKFNGDQAQLLVEFKRTDDLIAPKAPLLP